MDEKDLEEKELELNEDSPKETVEDSKEETKEKASLPKNATEFEDNDNWTFDAEAQTLKLDDMFVADDPKADASKIIEDIDESSSKEKEDKEEAKDNNQIVINKDSFIFIPGVLIVLIIAVILGFSGYRYYNVPNEKEGKLMNPGSVVMTVDGVKVSSGMFSYYYASIVNYFETYASYGQVNLDTSQSYDNQYTTDEDGNTITWSEYFQKMTLQEIESVTVYYGKALEDGIVLTDKQEETIKTQMDTVLEDAINKYADGKTADELTKKEKDAYLDKYIKSLFGKYVSTETIYAMFEQYYLAANYRGLYATKEIDSDYLATYTADHEKEYYNIDVCLLGLQLDTSSDEAREASIAKAQEYAETITDREMIIDMIPEVYADEIQNNIDMAISSASEEDGEELSEEEQNEIAESTRADIISQIEASTAQTISYTDSVQYFDETTTLWLFGNDENASKTNYYVDENSNYIYVLLKESEPYRDETTVYSIRHILISPDDLEGEAEETEETTTEDVTTEEATTAAEETAPAETGEVTDTETAVEEDLITDDTSSASEEGYTEEEMQKAFDFANELLNQFLDNDPTEAKFAMLAENNSSDTGSTSMSGQQGVFGGSYSVTENSNFVDTFKSWALDPERKNGDTGIVETMYGYHIMYFIESAPAYETYIKSDAKNAQLEEMLENAEMNIYQDRIDKTIVGYYDYKNILESSSQVTTQ